MRFQAREVKSALKTIAINGDLLCVAGILLLLFVAFVLRPIFQHGWQGTTPLVIVLFAGSSLYGFYRIVGPGSLARFYGEVNAVFAKFVRMVQLTVSIALLASFFLVPAVWLYMVFDSPQRSPAPGELDQAGVASFRVKGLLFRRMPDNGAARPRKYIPVKQPDGGILIQLNPDYKEYANFRLEQHKGFNLDIWVYQRDLEAIPYPDRKPFIESIGITWCDAPGLKDQHTLLPSIAVRDMRSGKELASYSCLLSSAELK